MSSGLARVEKILSHLKICTSNQDDIIKNNTSSSKRYKILFCGRGYPPSRDQQRYLSSQGHNVTLLPYPQNSKEAKDFLYQHVVIEKNIDYDAVINSDIPFSATIKGTILPNLKIVSNSSSGVPYDDIIYCKKYGISITNVPTETASTTADLAVGLMIATSRCFYKNVKYWKTTSAEEMKNNGWMNNFYGYCENTKDLYGSTVGIIGLGNIGREIAKRLSGGFGCNVYYFNGNNKQRKLYDIECGAKYMNSFIELIKISDFVAAVCPLNDNTRYMFNENVFKMMKNDAIFINVGRGQLVKTNDLINALKNKWILGAGLDVTDPEPLPSDHELWKLDNCTITPHIGTATIQCRTRMMNMAVQNMLMVLDGKPCNNTVR